MTIESIETTECIHENVREHYAAATLRATEGSSCCSADGAIGADALEYAAGVAGEELGVNLAIYPAKGYSITVMLNDEASQAAAPQEAPVDNAGNKKYNHAQGYPNNLADEQRVLAREGVHGNEPERAQHECRRKRNPVERCRLFI